MNPETPSAPAKGPTDVDVVVVGAGIAGLYALHRFRGSGLTVRVFEAGDGVGGVWYWNRYPGARCDVESVDYSYSFDDALQQEWNWSEKYATQPEILSYLEHVADRYDLRRDIEFGTRVTDIVLDEQTLRWQVDTDTGRAVSARFVVLATGPLSNANTPAIDGLDTFAGQILHTSHWPHEGVDLTGRRVGVIGTGSSGIQTIPCVAEQAQRLHVFQRTANYSVPAGNTPLTEQDRAAQKANYPERRRLSMASGGGSPHQAHPDSAVAVTDRERREAYEKRWAAGRCAVQQDLPRPADHPRRQRHRAGILGGEGAGRDRGPACRRSARSARTTPSAPSGSAPTRTTTRPSTATMSSWSNLKATPITRIDAAGVHTTDAHYPLDTLVLATGFDAMTGSVSRMNIVGRGGETLNQAWREGPKTYLGLGMTGFPNLFNLTGPGSPSVLANMVLHSELHVDWVAEAIGFLDGRERWRSRHAGTRCRSGCSNASTGPRER